MDKLKDQNVYAERYQKEQAITQVVKEIVKNNGEKECIAAFDILHKLVSK